MSFYKTFNKLCKVHDNTIVFRDWLDYIIDMLIVRGYHHVELLKQELKSIYPDMNDDTVLYQIIFELPEFPWELF